MTIILPLGKMRLDDCHEVNLGYVTGLYRKRRKGKEKGKREGEGGEEIMCLDAQRMYVNTIY